MPGARVASVELLQLRVGRIPELALHSSASASWTSLYIPVVRCSAYHVDRWLEGGERLSSPAP